MNVTTAGVSDLDDLLRLVAEYQEGSAAAALDDEHNAEFLKGLFNDRQAVVFIGRSSGGQAIGFATVHCGPQTRFGARIPQMVDLFVRESYRQQGFGRQLLQHAVRWARSHKHTTLMWSIENMNMPAQYLSDSVEGASQAGWMIYTLDLRKES